MRSSRCHCIEFVMIEDSLYNLEQEKINYKQSSIFKKKKKQCDTYQKGGVTK